LKKEPDRFSVPQARLFLPLAQSLFYGRLVGFLLTFLPKEKSKSWVRGRNHPQKALRDALIVLRPES
jgi:hypothetical protein